MNRPEIGSRYKSPTWGNGVVFEGLEYTVTMDEFDAGYTHAD